MCDEAATAPQRYRIVKPTLPAAISHWVGAIWAAAQSSVSPLPRPAWPSMHHIPGCRRAIGPFDQGSPLHNRILTQCPPVGRLPGKADIRSDRL
jgi:hypothetical protein